MALKITVERVANGTMAPGSHRVTSIANMSGDNEPFTVVVPDETTDVGIPINALRAFLNMGIQAKLNTAVTGLQISGVDVSIAAALALGHGALVTP